MGLIEDYFISPINDKTGYNVVNTLAYAAVAIGALYFIYIILQKKKVEIGKGFWLAVIAFVFAGSSMRVATDAIDSGAVAKFVAANPMHFMAGIYSAVLASHAMDYGYWTVTPGIYIVTAALFLSSYAIGLVMRKELFSAACGAAIAAGALLFLSPLFANWTYALMIVVIAVAAAGIVSFLLKISDVRFALPIFAHALDGTATWIAIDIAGPAIGVLYGEQHVLSRGIGESVGGASGIGFGLFFILKVIIASAAVYFIRKEKLAELELNLVLLAITVLGFAPGLRDMLRLLAGV